MTKHTTYVCDGCGEKNPDERMTLCLTTIGENLHPTESRLHYCLECHRKLSEFVRGGGILDA